MTNLLNAGVAWLTDQLAEHAGVAVTYHFRNGEAIELTAVKTAVDVEILQADGGVIQGQRIDWIIAAGVLLYAGGPAAPQEGDWIEQVIGQATHHYEVMPNGTEGHYRPRGVNGEAFRIHTRLVEKTE